MQHSIWASRQIWRLSLLIPKKGGVRNKLQRGSGHESAHRRGGGGGGGAILMSPAIWSALPKDLLERVFARLPLADMIRLQCLSKEWNQKLTSTSSAFKMVCADANPKLQYLQSSPGCVS